MTKLSDIKVGDRISFHGETGVVVERTRAAKQLKVRADAPKRRGLAEVWIVDAEFWFNRGELKAVDDGFNRD